MKPIQRFSKEYSEQARNLTPTQAARFVEDFRRLYWAAKPVKSRLISMKVPEPLLDAFKTKARSQGLRYQTQIKKLMQDWLSVQ